MIDGLYQRVGRRKNVTGKRGRVGRRMQNSIANARLDSTVFHAWSRNPRTYGLSDCLYEEQLESEPEESEGGLGADGIGDGDACRWPLLTVGICRYLF